MKGTATMELVQATQLFLLFKTGENLTRRTVEWYATELANFAAAGCWLLAAGRKLPPLEAIMPIDIVNYLVMLQNQGKSAVTVEGAYRALLAFFNWCEASPTTGHIPSPLGHGPSKTVKRPKVDAPKMDYCTFEEYITLTRAIDLGTWLDYRDWSMIGLMFWCGVRRGELLQMELGDVDLAQNRIRIRHSKARRQRSIFLIEDVSAGLRQYLMLRPKCNGDFLWAAYDKARHHIAGALSETGLRMMLKRRCKRAEMRYLNPHLFRHGFAMAYLNHGVDLKAVGDLMGHTSYKTTEKHYARWIDEPLRRIHQKAAEAIAAGC
jgi:integrase